MTQTLETTHETTRIAPRIAPRIVPRLAPRFAPRIAPHLVTLIGIFLLPAIWIATKEFLHVSDRYLPSPISVLRACMEIEPNVALHTLYTAVRLILGFLAGIAAGVTLGICINKWTLLSKLLRPALDAMRSVPAIAIVPFFLLWFGFSETGRILLVVCGIAFNIAVATQQALSEMPEKHRVLFRSFGISPASMTWTYTIPRIMETLLPTVRFSLATAFGVVIASELLGSQMGLGYLMQTARSTFAMQVIFLATILLGLLNAILDKIVTHFWTRAVYWR